MLGLCEINVCQVEHRAPDGEEVQQETTREIGIETLMTHGSWRKYTAHHEGSHGQGTGREAEPGARAIIGGSICGGLWASGLRPENLKEQGFAKLYEGLI